MRYFAYGSNMSLKRLQYRVPSAKTLGIAVLAGHQLRFHKIGSDGSGKCNALHTGKPEHQVFGVLFEISALEKGKLDEAEGLGCGYEMKDVLLMKAESGTVEAFTYYATAMDAALKPCHWYKEHVLRGAIENGLPKPYIESIEAVVSVADLDVKRQQRELAIYE